jgi:hypothetical protein
MLVPSLCIFQTMSVQTLPSAILQEKLRKAKKSRSRSASSTNLLENSDGLDYRSTGEHRDGLLTESENSVGATQPPPLRALLLMPRVSIAVINSSVFFFCDMNRHVLTPLMWSTSLEHGGLGFTPYAIGLAMGIFGAVNMCVQATFLGKIIRYFGARKVFTASLVAYLVSILCFPLEKYFAQRAGGTDWRVWTVIAVQLAMYCLITPAYGESIIFALARQYPIPIFSFHSGFDHGQCAKPVCPWFCERLGSGCNICFEGASAQFCVVIICHLAAAKLGRRGRSLLHIDGFGGLCDPTFFHAARRVASTMNSLFRGACVPCLAQYVKLAAEC